MESVLERLQANQHRSSTKRNYLSIWRQFNAFLICLDERPKDWEDHASLFCVYLAESGNKSSTIRSYISAIKHNLIVDKYKWDDNKVLVNAVSRVCKIANDVVIARFPIHIGYLEMLIFELERLYASSQPYLNIAYRALFLVAYYGLMRIGELTQSEHTVKAKDVHIGSNKNKILLVLYSSKMHGKESPPQ